MKYENRRHLDNSRGGNKHCCFYKEILSLALDCCRMMMMLVVTYNITPGVQHLG